MNYRETPEFKEANKAAAIGFFVLLLALPVATWAFEFGLRTGLGVSATLLALQGIRVYVVMWIRVRKMKKENKND